MRPLNGTKTHPLSDLARAELTRLQNTPLPRQEFNPGVVDRLLRGALVKIADLPSPYKSHKGAPISHLLITKTGVAELEQSV